MAYVCLKACVLGGVQYGQGDSIPAEAVLPARACALQRMGYLTEASESPHTGLEEMKGIPETPIIVPVIYGDDAVDVPAMPEDIRTVFSILQKNADDAVKSIEAVEREEVLVLLRTADGRKTVKAAADARAKALGFAEEEEPGDA